MKRRLLCTIYLFFIFCSFLQAQKLVSGTISAVGIALENVDVVNTTTKIVVVTNENGNFSITAKENQELFIISKEYIDQKITLTPEIFEKNNLQIILEKKPIELDEVLIVKAPEMKLKVGYNELKAAKLERQQSRPTNTTVYTGEIVNGMDFIQMGKMLFGLFKGKKKKVKKEEIIDPKVYLKANFNTAFFITTLKLEIDEIGLFMEYCSADSNFIALVNSKDNFALIDLMIAKSELFRTKKF